MQPTYVTFPQAKRLKEIGFNEPCEWLYNEKGEPSGTKMGMRGKPNNYSTHYARPEYSQVMEWLRVNHSEVYESAFDYILNKLTWEQS